MTMYKQLAMLAAAGLAASACSYRSIAPGHRGLAYDPSAGLRRDILPEGKHRVGSFCLFHACGDVVDFDVTLSTHHEELKTTSQEGYALELQLSVRYKPIVAELYELDTEVGTNYYDEVIAPDLRSAASEVFAHHLYAELSTGKEKIENEIVAAVRRRINGHHVAVESIALESIPYAPEMANAVKARLIAEQENLRQRAAMEQDSARQKSQMESDALKNKLALEQETARAQQEIQSRAAEQELKLRTELEEKKNERAMAEEDAKLEKALAVATIEKARAEAEARTILARAKEAENRAETQAISPLTVQMKAYEALGQLGGTGTTILLGDFSKLPAWLLPAGLTSAGNPFTRQASAARP